jgi:tetratricopeptide (TPR) repeat protein
MSLPADAEQVIGSNTPAPTRRRRIRWWLVLLGLTALVLVGWYGGRHLWGMMHLRAAEKALQRYEFAKASAEFEYCLRVWPNRTNVRFQAARAARRADQLERADEYLAECEQAGITSDTALERMMLGAQKGDSRDDELELASLVRHGHPDTVLILEAVARGCMRVYRRKDAISLLSALVERVPEHSEALFWLGNQYADEGPIAAALPCYERALQIAPHRTDYRLGLADALVRFSQPSEAWPHFEELLRQSPHDPAVLLGAARCQRDLGQHSAALEHLDVLLSDHPDHAEAWAERGRVYRDQGNHAEAIHCLRRGFELAPFSYRIAFTLLNELRGEKKTGEASALLEKLNRLHAESERLHELMARLNKQPDSAPLRFQIGMIFMRNGLEDEAVRWLKGALRYDPRYQPALDALAEYYKRKGKAKP